MKFRPSQLQAALACYMLATSQNAQQSLWQLPPSIGKSVIKHVIALFALAGGLCTRVHLVNPNLSLE